MKYITVFGLGEAGSLYASDLVNLGLKVRAYDPANVTTPEGVERYATPQEAVQDSEAIIALTAAANAREALNQALDDIPQNALYADFSTASSTQKRELAETAENRGLPFVDVALLSIVPGNGIETKALASGSGSERFVELFKPLGMPVQSISDIAGDAATRKLLRSVFMKGLAAVCLEAMRGAEKAGLEQWLWRNLADEINSAGEVFLRRLLTGTETHATRRLHEMEAAEAQLKSLRVEPIMTQAIVANLDEVLKKGIPAIPNSSVQEGCQSE